MRLGRHMPTNSRPVLAAATAKKLGCEAIQIFGSNPTGWQMPADNLSACTAFAEAAKLYELDPVVLHAPYLINLASPEEENWMRSYRLLVWTMQRAALLGGTQVVVHMGSHKGAGLEGGIERSAEGIISMLAETPESVMVLLENGVGTGNMLGKNFEEIQAVLERIPSSDGRVGVCLDTAHLWGAGYDVSSPEAVLDVLQQFDQIIGLKRLKVLHLNDSLKLLGSQRDGHARWGEGQIGTGGLRSLLTDARLQHVAALMETPIKLTDQKKEDWEHDRAHFQLVESFRTPDLDLPLQEASS